MEGRAAFTMKKSNGGKNAPARSTANPDRRA